MSAQASMDTDDGATSIVEMLFYTSLVALVSAGDKVGSSPRRLVIVNTKVRATRLNPLDVISAKDFCLLVATINYL
jgi:hypothetical protein